MLYFNKQVEENFVIPGTDIKIDAKQIVFADMQLFYEGNRARLVLDFWYGKERIKKTREIFSEDKMAPIQDQITQMNRDYLQPLHDYFLTRVVDNVEFYLSVEEHE